MEKFNNSSRFNKVDLFGDKDYDKLSVAKGIIDMSAQSVDYRIDSTGYDGEFLPPFMFLIPETSGAIVVQLKGMTEGVTYTISAAQITANMGKVLPFKVTRVLKSGTTATFSVTW